MSETVTLIDDRFGAQTQIEARLARYSNGGALAIEFVIASGPETGMPYCRATVNVPDAGLAENEVAVKSWNEGMGLPELMLKADLITGAPVRHVESGHVRIPVYRIGEAAKRLLAEAPPPEPEIMRRRHSMH